MTTKDLNRRQIRWAEMMSEFGFKIMYRPGKQGGKPDALTRQPQDLPIGAEDARNEYQHQILLKEDRLDDKVKQDFRLCIMIRASTRREQQERESTSQRLDKSDESEIEESENLGELREEETDRLINQAYEKDELVNSILEAKRTGARKLSPRLLRQGVKLAMGDLEIRNDRVYHKPRLLISNSVELKLHSLRKHHEPPCRDIQGIEVCIPTYW
jgi:hypothetical protein